MQQTLFQLKFTAKQLVRSSKKCEKNEKAQRKKIKKAIEQGNMEGARIYATNAIREKKQALNFLKLSSRIDGVRYGGQRPLRGRVFAGACGVEGRRHAALAPPRSRRSAHGLSHRCSARTPAPSPPTSALHQVASRVETAVSMGQLTRSMGGVVNGMEGVLKSMDPDKITAVMDKFEKQFEDLDVSSAYMAESMDGSTACNTPEGDIESLMSEVADEHGLDFAGKVGAAPTTEVVGETADVAEDDLAARLARLRGP